MDGPGQQSWEAPAAEGDLRKANSGMAPTPGTGAWLTHSFCVGKGSCSRSALRDFGSRKFSGFIVSGVYTLSCLSCCVQGMWGTLTPPLLRELDWNLQIQTCL